MKCSPHTMLIAIYRPPKHSAEVFPDELSELLSDFVRISCTVTVVCSNLYSEHLILFDAGLPPSVLEEYPTPPTTDAL